MGEYKNFWVITILRGVLAILIGSALIVVPDMARNILLLPFAIAVVIISLVGYGVADSILVFVTSFFTSLRPIRSALRLQSLAGVVIGILFASLLFDRIQLGWFLYLIALQAFATAYYEFIIARHTAKKHGSRSCYVAASAALLCAMTYAIAATLAPAELTARQISSLAYAYLAFFGAAQVMVAARMLYIELHTDNIVRA